MRLETRNYVFKKIYGLHSAHTQVYVKNTDPEGKTYIKEVDFDNDHHMRMAIDELMKECVSRGGNNE